MKLEDVYNQVVGLVPLYTDEGNATRIICWPDDDMFSFTDTRQVEGIKRLLARNYALDLSAQAAQLQKNYHRSPPLPFHLPDGRIFVPFKLRLARIAGDACYGYIELKIIDHIVPGEKNRCLLLLTNGQTLPVYSQITTARLALYFGLEIQKANKRKPDPDQDLMLAFHILRRYLTVKQ
ncbi:MAG: hypothetical protein ABFD18_07380 [Syntrophomonas sp.]